MKTLEIESLGLNELEVHESSKVNGGFILEALAAAYIGIVLYEAMENPKRILNGAIDALT